MKYFVGPVLAAALRKYGIPEHMIHELKPIPTGRDYADN